MKHRFSFLFLFLSVTLSIVSAKSIKVGNLTQYNEAVKIVSPGDSIILANGVWKDARLVLKGVGEKDKNIYLTAETFGQVKLEGQSNLKLSGQWLHISGLVFVNGYTPDKSVIQFKTSSKDYAYNCKVTNCVIDGYSKLYKDTVDNWLDLWGQKNTIEFCYFGGKTNEGTTLIVCPNDSNSMNNQHWIYRNYFGNRPRLGSNGGESIRIGTSQVCLNSSGTIVEGNFFERCNGEVEIISNKSCDNKFLNNTFYECEGSLVLRHGNRAVVSGNWFIGNGKEYTGGVRVINEGHLIYNNFFYKLTGDEFRSALAIMNAIPDSPLSGYAPVRDVLIANNTFMECTNPWSFCVGFGFRNRIVRPEGVQLVNNIVYSPKAPELIKSYDTPDGIKLDNNLMVGIKGMSTESGSVQSPVHEGKIWGQEMVYSTAPAKVLPLVKFDILGQPRNVAVIGAFQNQGEKAKIDQANAKNCGPTWYKPAPKSLVKSEGVVVKVAVGTDNLVQAVKNAKDGSVLMLEAGEHLITQKIVLSKDLTIRAATNATVKPILKLKTNKGSESLFEITGNPRILIQGLAIDGDSKAEFPAKYAFATSKVMAMDYSLFIDRCDIYDFNVETGSIFKAYKGTMADSLKVTNSVLRNSRRGFNLGEEKTDVGKYSAEKLCFDNTVFHHFTEYIVDFYRGGTDESTLGGTLKINHCVFDAVATTAGQTIFKLTGIVNVSILNSIISNSPAKTLVNLAGTKNAIGNCCLSNCAKPKLENGATSQNIHYAAPGFQGTSYMLSNKSPLFGKATDGGKIGLR
ncbi:MAG TPA: polysaccharide lyase 6 family protein [Bacteroidales bacterium]|nr:polysaccharide lyase 6 family protein [Bacteroidales bacterium]